MESDKRGLDTAAAMTHALVVVRGPEHFILGLKQP